MYAIGAQMVGLSAGCFEHVMPYMYERKQFGTHIGDFQAMQHQFAQVMPVFKTMYI
jgi:short-chain 2-methylacyl-CoA dehydrogenase